METDWKFPPCFKTHADYELWLDSPNTETHLKSQHCTDCLPSYKMRMAKAGRCEHPETTFAFYPSSFDGEDGVAIVGHRGSRPVREVDVPPAQPPVEIVRFVKKPKPPRPPKPEKKSGLEWALERHRSMLERMKAGR